MRHYTAESYVRMPWKNGAGFTTEVARSGPVEGYDWRLSIADVATDGPFSSFPDYWRVITVLEGAGMHLTVDSQPSGALSPFEAFTFDGAGRTECALVGGPIRDFNLIYRKGRIDSRLTWIELSNAQHLVTDAPTILIFAAVGQAALRCSQGDGLLLGEQELARIENGTGAMLSLDIEGERGAHAAVIELWTREGEGGSLPEG
ncbi:HutD/Ves family protein [Arthrobacter sp. Soil782]|uniref:HutD/Ves family protein n=1 Tax=Arthrobacter sp. Soil782 TaxID=1736410 RepID=UPI0009EAC569|nr:HutD family protein [Arthrobacter sp. Soil782]